MKRMMVVLAAVMSLVLVSLIGWAQNQTGSGGPMMGTQGRVASQRPLGPPGPMPHGIGAFIGRALVATTDGGVVVLSGEKLMKFDKNLNLVKEVEVKIDTAAMDRWLEQMGNRYGQCWGWRGKGGRGSGRMIAPRNQ